MLEKTFFWYVWESGTWLAWARWCISPCHQARKAQVVHSIPKTGRRHVATLTSGRNERTQASHPKHAQIIESKCVNQPTTAFPSLASKGTTRTSKETFCAAGTCANMVYSCADRWIHFLCDWALFPSFSPSPPVMELCKPSNRAKAQLRPRLHTNSVPPLTSAFCAVPVFFLCMLAFHAVFEEEGMSSLGFLCMDAMCALSGVS